MQFELKKNKIPSVQLLYFVLHGTLPALYFCRFYRYRRWSPRWGPEWSHVFHFLLQLLFILNEFQFYSMYSSSNINERYCVVKIKFLVSNLKYLKFKNLKIFCLKHVKLHIIVHIYNKQIIEKFKIYKNQILNCYIRIIKKILKILWRQSPLLAPVEPLYTATTSQFHSV